MSEGSQNKKRIQINIEATPELRRRVAILAAQLGTNRSEVCRRAIELYLAAQENPS